MKGGEEKIEEVRLGIFSFKREVEGLKEKVNGKTKEVEGLVIERKAIREQIQLGRKLLDIDQRLQDLEARLMIDSNGEAGPAEDNEDSGASSESEVDTEDEETGGIPTSRLRRHAQRYLYIARLSDRIGLDHPFLSKQQGRMMRLKNTVLLDLSNALKESRRSKDQARTMKILGIYREMDEANEVIKLLKDIR